MNPSTSTISAARLLPIPTDRRVVHFATRTDAWGGKARTLRPRSKWSHSTMGIEPAAIRAGAKELQCKETEVHLQKWPCLSSNLYIAWKKEGPQS